jgi:hypothetical protein
MSVGRILGALANFRGLVAKKISWRGRGGHRIHLTGSTLTWSRVTIRRRWSVVRDMISSNSICWVTMCFWPYFQVFDLFVGYRFAPDR